MTTFNQDKTARTANLMRNNRHFIQNYFLSSGLCGSFDKHIPSIISVKQSIRKG